MKKYRIKHNDKVYELEVEVIEEGQEVPVAKAKPDSATHVTSIPTCGGDDVEVTAPMQGTILDLKVSDGHQVKAGDTLMILEAMKLENDIVAPKDGIVKSIHVSKGSNVATGECLLVMV